MNIKSAQLIINKGIYMRSGLELRPKEIGGGVHFYLAILNMMKAEKANAVTIDCFGTLAAKTLPGYPRHRVLETQRRGPMRRVRGRSGVDDDPRCT